MLNSDNGPDSLREKDDTPSIRLLLEQAASHIAGLVLQHSVVMRAICWSSLEVAER